jgi:Ca2+-binding EF-hand superfamily protein
MGEVDIDNMVKDLDYNKDGKISPEEFNMWWLAGRKG